MALNANALLTLADAKTYLVIVGAESDAVIEDIINRTSDYCEWWTGRPLKARAFTALRLAAPCGTTLRPPAAPIDVTQAVTLEDNGTALTIWKSEADGDPTLKDVIVGADAPGTPSHFVRPTGWKPTAGNPFPVKLSYTGGFAVIPGDLKEAAYLVFENVWRAQQKKLTDVVALGGPAGTVSFRGELIPMKAKQILDSYRWTGV